MGPKEEDQAEVFVKLGHREVKLCRGDPGDEVNDAELAWKRKLAERADRSGNVSTTWDPER